MNGKCIIFAGNPKNTGRDFNCTRPEPYQHTFHLFNYWIEAMPQLGYEIVHIMKVLFREGLYAMNMLMDKEDGMTLECWFDC